MLPPVGVGFAISTTLAHQRDGKSCLGLGVGRQYIYINRHKNIYLSQRENQTLIGLFLYYQLCQ